MKTETQSPTLRLDPEQPLYLAGETLILRCAADMSKPNTSYSFFKDARSVINNSDRNTFTLSPLSREDTGNYFCTSYQMSDGTKPQSNRVYITVIGRPSAPTLSIEPQRKVFVVNESVIIRCRIQREIIASEINLYQSGSIIYESDNYGVLTLANTEKKNTGNYTCAYKTVIQGHTVNSEHSNPVNLVVIDLPPTPILRYAYSLSNRSSETEIVCEIPNPSSSIHGYRLYRNGGEISSSHANRFVKNYSLEFDGCYFCRSFVTMLGEQILSPKSTEVFLALEEKNRRSCQNSASAYSLSSEGFKLYGSVLIGKLIVLVSILLTFGTYLLVNYLRSNKSETEE
ncbi:hypothetical protein PRIEUP_LOCUS354, partial [Pristimantis euphronides]